MVGVVVETWREKIEMGRKLKKKSCKSEMKWYTPIIKRRFPSAILQFSPLFVRLGFWRQLSIKFLSHRWRKFRSYMWKFQDHSFSFRNSACLWGLGDCLLAFLSNLRRNFLSFTAVDLHNLIVVTTCIKVCKFMFEILLLVSKGVIDIQRQWKLNNLD